MCVRNVWTRTIIQCVILAAGAWGCMDLFGTRLHIQADSVPGPWYSLRGGMSNTANGFGSSAFGKQRWSYDGKAGVCSTPVIGDDGTVYVAIRDGNLERLVALEGVTGKTRWIRQVNRRKPYEPELGTIIGPSCPAIGTEGLVYVRFDDRKVYAIRTDDGKVQWVFSAENDIVSSLNVDGDGNVYFNANGGVLYALDGATGECKWKRKVAGGMFGIPAIDSGTCVYIGSYKGLTALQRATGEEVWTVAGDSRLYSPAIGPSGLVYIATVGTGGGAEVVAVDRKSGQIRWRTHVGRLVNSYLAIAVDSKVYVTAHVSAMHGHGMHDSLYALDGETGEIIWQRRFLPLEINSSPVVDANGDVILIYSGRVSVLDGKSGRQKWTVDLRVDQWVPPPAVGSDGTIYIGTSTGRVCAIR